MRPPSAPASSSQGAPLDEGSLAEQSRKLLRLAEEQGRLTTTGLLAAGVGHEINNPLTVVTANLDLISEVLGEAGPLAEADRGLMLGAVADAQASVERIKRLVRGLRALARTDGELALLSVPETLELSLQMAAHELRRKATVQREWGELPRVLADEARLSQLFVNLLVHAARSFERTEPGRNQIVIHAFVEDQRTLAVEFRDNGPGLDAEGLKRIFDPFFSTGAGGEGRALGLAVSHGLAVALGGELTAHRGPSGGSLFRVRLPLPGAASTSSPPSG